MDCALSRYGIRDERGGDLGWLAGSDLSGDERQELNRIAGGLGGAEVVSACQLSSGRVALLHGSLRTASTEGRQYQQLDLLVFPPPSPGAVLTVPGSVDWQRVAGAAPGPYGLRGGELGGVPPLVVHGRRPPPRLVWSLAVLVLVAGLLTSAIAAVSAYRQLVEQRDRSDELEQRQASLRSELEATQAQRRQLVQQADTLAAQIDELRQQTVILQAQFDESRRSLAAARSDADAQLKAENARLVETTEELQRQAARSTEEQAAIRAWLRAMPESLRTRREE